MTIAAPTSRVSVLARGARGLLLAGAAAALVSCSLFDDFQAPWEGEKYKMKIEPDIPASKAYDQGLAQLANGAPADAAKKFTALGEKFPDSDWARKGLLMTTYAQYEGGDLDSAEASAERYVKLYPKSQEAAYALYLEANSYYRQIPDISRDQERAGKALVAFQQVVRDYPNSEYVEDSKYKIQVTTDQLAGKEMSIGRFYLNRRNYTAAINRFREVLFKYQNTRESEEALERLTEAYLAMGIVDEAQTAAAVLGHNYPESEWYKEALDRLKTDGYAPQDHQDSWISKVFRKVGMT